ncbi:putative HicB family RNase H-like nuclease [Bradyrhizobium elkanii]|nr:putative HicB family RNase H-like nuclease [Bradyrhizobium elkanii]MCW2167860.1 putative HicB family RNase H-like nuclease [Bradyrhizobium elkanii]
MSNPVRYSSEIHLRCAPEVTEQIDAAARKHGQKQSEYVRQAVLKALRADGIDPITAGRAS